MSTEQDQNGGDAVDQRDILDCITRPLSRPATTIGRSSVAERMLCDEAQGAGTGHAKSAGSRSRGAGRSQPPRAAVAERPAIPRQRPGTGAAHAGRDRVIGGTHVPKKDFLDCVAVGNDTEWGCTGTLIAPDVVVSAGHCSNYATRVFFGSDVSKPGRIV